MKLDTRLLIHYIWCLNRFKIYLLEKNFFCPANSLRQFNFYFYYGPEILYIIFCISDNPSYCHLFPYFQKHVNSPLFRSACISLHHLYFHGYFKSSNSIFKRCTATVLKIIHCISLNVDRLLNESYFNERPHFIVHPAQVANSSSGKESRKTLLWSAWRLCSKCCMLGFIKKSQEFTQLLLIVRAQLCI